jgi:hypothetical protein
MVERIARTVGKEPDWNTLSLFPDPILKPGQAFGTDATVFLK